MKHFVDLKDIPAKDLKKIIIDAKKRKIKRKKLNALDFDSDRPLKGKFLIQMFEKSSLRTRLSFFLAISQLSGRTLSRFSQHQKVHMSLGILGTIMKEMTCFRSTTVILPCGYVGEAFRRLCMETGFKSRRRGYLPTD